MDTALLGLRVALSLACVLGLIWFAGRRLQGTGVVRKQRTVPLSVLGRQSLGKGAGIALVEVAGRVLLLGVGEQGVRLLTEVDVPEVPAAGPAERGSEVREEIDLSILAAADPAVPDDVASLLTPADHTTADVAGLPDGAVVPQAHADGTARLAALAGLAASKGSTGTAETGALHGSVLSPDTWRRAVDVVQRRTARR